MFLGYTGDELFQIGVTGLEGGFGVAITGLGFYFLLIIFGTTVESERLAKASSAMFFSTFLLMTLGLLTVAISVNPLVLGLFLRGEEGLVKCIIALLFTNICVALMLYQLKEMLFQKKFTPMFLRRYHDSLEKRIKKNNE